MFRTVAAVLSLVAAASAAFTATVKDCAPGSIFTLNAVDLTPASPNPGDPVTLHLDYTVPEGVTVTDGTTTYAVTLNFIPFAPSTNPLCQDIPCPLGPGTYKNATTSTWPTGVSGTFTSKMTWANPAGETLMCVQTSGKMMENKSLALVPYIDAFLPVPATAAVAAAPRGSRNLRG